ncbi:hypothetical protein LWI28_009950 [Acer negundo]|uniref:Uncharacterized protein n=1 Tax=Acer negundo TaxID=4023 RepID=A0AAD5IEB0_ACENE|nr:hypothetical protein LWI28_009950 [Acer negundo]
MWSLEELKFIDDGGSFDLIVQETEKAANGDELLKLELLTDSEKGKVAMSRTLLFECSRFGLCYKSKHIFGEGNGNRRHEKQSSSGTRNNSVYVWEILAEAIASLVSH